MFTNTSLISFLLITLLLLSCEASKLITPSETNLIKAKQSFPDVTFAQLNEGKQKFQEHCNGCHSYKTSMNKSEGKLFMEVPSMVKKVNKRKGENTINTEQQEAIIRYLVSVSNFGLE